MSSRHSATAARLRQGNLSGLTSDATLPDDEAELWAMYVADRSNTTVRNAILTRYEDFVRWVAVRYTRLTSTRRSPEELFSDGWFGLLRSVERFEPERGRRFTTYAYFYVRVSMQESDRRSWHRERDSNRLYREKTALSHKRGRRVTIEEAAEQCGIEFAEAHRLTQYDQSKTSVSLDAAPFLAELSTSPEHLTDVNDEVSRLLKLCLPQHRSLLWERYAEGVTTNEIAARTGVTRQAVSAQAMLALRQIQRRMKSDSSKMQLSGLSD